MAIKKNHINVLISVLLIMVITGCSGNGSKSNTKGHSWTDSHTEIQDTQMVRLDAFKKGMQ